MQNGKFPKKCRIHGKKRIDRIFAEGKAGFVHPFRYVCVQSDDSRTQGEATDSEGRDTVADNVAVLISVSKRYHKRANRRNLIKRRIREAFRCAHARDKLSQALRARGKSVDIALVYITKDVADHNTISNAVERILGKILADI